MGWPVSQLTDIFTQVVYFRIEWNYAVSGLQVRKETQNLGAKKT